MPQHCQLDSCRLRYFAGRLDADGHLVSNTWTPTPKQGDKLRPGTPAAAAALPREDAGQQLLSQPQSRGCNPLHAIRDVLHVSSFLASSVDAALLLGHWLSHYIYGLGVVPSHLHLIVLRNSSSSSDATGHAAVLSQLRRHAIDPESQVRVLDNVVYTDKLKLDVVNDWLHALPLDAWALFADSDEFFSFPCGLGEELRNATTITSSSACQRPKHGGGHAGVMPCADRIYCARMKDRLAIDGTIAPLKPSPDISVQYPWECGSRQTLSSNPSKGQFNTLKTALFKAWPASSSSRGVMTGKGEPRQFRNPHSLVNEYRTQSARTLHTNSPCLPRLSLILCSNPLVWTGRRGRATSSAATRTTR